MTQLSEIPVDLATGQVKRIYEEIQYRSGAAVPALLFRHLASRPPLLEWLWASAGPRFIDGSIQAAARSLVASIGTDDQPRLNSSRERLQALGVSSEDRAALRSVLDTYNRMNPMNLLTIQLCIRILGQPAGPAYVNGREVTPPYPLPDIPAAVALQAMRPDTKQLTQELSGWVPVSVYGSITPTLYRHLANWPAFLKLVGAQLLERLEQGSIQKTTETLQAHSAALAALLPGTAAAWLLTADQRSEFKAAIDPFFVCIPQLIVVGKLISESI